MFQFVLLVLELFFLYDNNLRCDKRFEKVLLDHIDNYISTNVSYEWRSSCRRYSFLHAFFVVKSTYVIEHVPSDDDHYFPGSLMC